MNKQLVLMRGLPGAGKSTAARAWASGDANRVHVETDMWFERDGAYMFDASKLSEAHTWCQQACKSALQQGKSVVVYNTFVKRWEMQPYINMARELNVDIEVREVHGNFTNIHGVPQEVINRMRHNWEQITQETV